MKKLFVVTVDFFFKDGREQHGFDFIPAESEEEASEIAKAEVDRLTRNELYLDTVEVRLEEVTIPDYEVILIPKGKSILL